MKTLAPLPRQERPALLIISKGLTRHIQVLWVIKKLLFSCTAKTALNGHIVAFSYDIVAGDTTTTITIIDDWWDLDELTVPAPHTADSEVTNLIPEDHSIPEATTVAEQACIPLGYIVPLALVHLLLTAPYLSPAAAYTIFLARSTAWIWDAPLAPLMKRLRASLFQTCPEVKSLPNLEMADHITVGRKNLQQQLVPRTPTGPATSALNYTVHQAQQVAPEVPVKKKNLEECWDLQASSFYRLANIQGPQYLPEILQTLPPLKKEKARPAFEISCMESARSLRFKAP